MRIIIQRSLEAHVKVKDNIVSKIPRGLVILVGLTHDDTQDDVEWLANKVAKLRIFSDAEGVMNDDITKVGGEILLISQFTLYASTRKGNRPSYIKSAKPEVAKSLYVDFGKCLREKGLTVKEGIFGADMQVSLVNDGPVTIMIDSKNRE